MKKANLIPLLMLPYLLFGLGLAMKNEVGFYHLYMSDPAYFDDLLIKKITDE